MAGATAGTVHQQLSTLIRARVSCIGLKTHEEERAEGMIDHICANLVTAKGEPRPKNVVVWTVTKGFVVRNPMRGSLKPYLPATPQDKQQPIFDPAIALLSLIERREMKWLRQADGQLVINNTSKLPEQVPFEGDEADEALSTVYVFEDLHHFMKQPKFLRALRDTLRDLVMSRKTVILLSPVLWAEGQSGIPADLEKEITVVDLPLPGPAELRRIVKEAARTKLVPVHLSETDADRLVEALRGLTQVEAEATLRQAMIENEELSASAIKTVLTEKDQIVMKSGALEAVPEILSLSEVGGYDLFKEYMADVDDRSSPEALNYMGYAGDMPKGVLAVGPQGVGKSTIARTAGGARRKVYRLAVDKIMGGIVGETEARTTAALKIADAMGVTLWIDELEKLFGETNGGSGNGRVEGNQMGILLTWMQEQKNCYVFATANHLAPLNGPLRRRFDAIFLLLPPTTEERKQILAVHLRKRGRDAEAFDLDAVAAATTGYSGADLEKIVQRALDKGRREGYREIDTADLLYGISRVNRTIKPSDVDEVLAECEGVAMPASIPEAGVQAAGPFVTKEYSTFDSIEV